MWMGCDILKWFWLALPKLLMLLSIIHVLIDRLYMIIREMSTQIHSAFLIRFSFLLLSFKAFKKIFQIEVPIRYMIWKILSPFSQVVFWLWWQYPWSIKVKKKKKFCLKFHFSLGRIFSAMEVCLSSGWVLTTINIYRICVFIKEL